MKHTLLFAAIAATALLCTTRCTETPATAEQEAVLPTHEDTVKRGEYLVNAMGCDDCHSPKRMGEHGPEVIPETRLSGYPGDRPFDMAVASGVQAGWVLFGPDLTNSIGPWGASFSANLTSDETGLGNWTLDQFKKALREGKYKGLDSQRPLLPPMPWQAYGQLNDDDLSAIFAFLKSTKPVKNVPPPPVPPAQAQ